MEITGYSNREMLDRYNTYNTNHNENRKEAVRRLEGFLTIEAANIEKTLTNDGVLCENSEHAVSGSI
jgi:hypothetical protein